MAKHEYQEFNPHVVIGDGIEDFHPYYITLPAPKDLKKTKNYGLPKEEQLYRRDVIPDKIRRLNRLPLAEAWAIAQKDSEIMRFIQSQWDKRVNGEYCYIYGQPYYITGDHWYYLNVYQLDEGYPDWRWVDAEYFYIWKYAVEETNNCYGLIEMTIRRDGKSYRSGSVMLNKITRTSNANGGIQSKTNADAVDMFQRCIVMQWRQSPFYFSPVYDNTSFPRKEINFRIPSAKGTANNISNLKDAEELNSWIEARSTVEIAFDGTKLVIYILDEAGKCLAKDTPILMYDGGIKMVQDVVVGDVLMGDDSTPRNVLSVNSGQEQMYNIVPNKGMEWGCNESHILSLRSCSTVYGYKKNEIVNISVSDYLKLDYNRKKHLVLWRTSVEYAETENDIDPYMFGIWLGDGNSVNQKIYNVDKEIISYLQAYCDLNGYNLITSIDKRTNCGMFTISSGQGVEGFLRKLKDIDVYGNKHIPNGYLINSRKNRLELLAGLLDTDGSLNVDGNKVSYEITQKNKRLSDEIHILANSLGFYCSKVEKMATMKRADGTYYKCLVYRMGIYGSNLHEIPCKVERKKAPHIINKHKNTRNPLRTGFKLQKKDIGDYYGFTIDGNRLFVLGDYTVTHNTVDMKVDDTWRVVKQCLRVRDKIVGRCIITSTIEELTRKGGQQFKNIWDNSDRNPTKGKINSLGQTVSGLVPYFKPAYSTYRFDQYGFSVIGKPLPHQEAYFRKKKMVHPDKGGKELIEIERKEIKNSNERQAHIRMYPNTIREAFRPDFKDCAFNSAIIDERLEYFTFDRERDLVRGNFEWIDGVVGGNVMWRPNPDGYWLMRYILSQDKANQSKLIAGKKSPASFDKFGIGCDPFKYNITTSNKPSQGSGYIWMYFDEALDRDKEEPDWLSDDFVGEFYGRPPTVDAFSEEMLKAAIYHGCKVNPENNAGSVWTTFERLALGQYLHFGRKLKKEGNSTQLVLNKTPGSTTLGSAVKDAQFASMGWYIDTHGHRCKFANLLEAARYVEYDNLSPYDAFMGAVQTLMPVRELKQRPKVEPKSFQSFMPMRKY